MPYSRKSTQDPGVEHERAAMAELHARDLSNEATPVPAPVIQHCDIIAAQEAGELTEAAIDEPEGDGDWAVAATEHVESERERIHEELGGETDEDDLDRFEAPEVTEDDYGNPARKRDEPWVAPEAEDDDEGFIPPNGVDPDEFRTAHPHVDNDDDGR